MSNCQVCHHDPAIHAWQPFGPDSTSFLAEMGWHYRGFPVIKVCEECAMIIRRRGVIEFTYRGQRYIAGDGKCLVVPAYVSDPLAWFEDQK